MTDDLDTSESDTECRESSDPLAEPEDLSGCEVEAKCEAEVTIILKEPDEGKNRQGFSWTGVDGIKVIIEFGTNRFERTTKDGGVADFGKIPCGSYSVSMWQDEFFIKNLDSNSIKANGASKNKNDFEIKILRQLVTIEMFRLGTQYLAATGVKSGNGDDTYGHHWIKLYASIADSAKGAAMESYGWWPALGALNGSLSSTISGVRGVLNGYDNTNPSNSYAGASPTTDPYHTKPRTYKNLEETFFPWVTGGKAASEYKNIVRMRAKNFARDVSNEWSWRTNSGGWHCKTFQVYLMTEAEIWKRVGVGIGSFGWSTGT